MCVALGTFSSVGTLGQRPVLEPHRPARPYRPHHTPPPDGRVVPLCPGVALCVARLRSSPMPPTVMSTWCSTTSARWAGAGARPTRKERPHRAVEDLLEGQYNNPVRVIAFNTVAGWSRDVSAEIADELAQSWVQDIPVGLRDFIQRHASGRPAQLPLPLRLIA